MRTRVVLGVLLVAVVGVYHGGNLLTAHLIATRLPAALTADEGSPVAIKGVSANVWTLRAYADEFIYGLPERPYAHLREVSIELDGTDLLNGVVQLGTGAAVEADFWPERLPTDRDVGPDDDAETTDFADIEPWLPNLLEFGSFDVLSDAEELLYGAEKVSWRRDGETRLIGWQRRRGIDLLRFEAQLPDIDSIVQRRSADVVVRVFTADSRDTIMALHLLSEERDGRIESRLAIEGEGIQATLTFESEALFDMPAESLLEIKNLATEELTVHASLLDTGTEAIAQQQEETDLLRAPLPVFDLPRHDLKVVAEQVGFDDEIVRDVEATLHLHPAAEGQPARIEAPQLRAHGPRADIDGSLAIALGEDWQVSLDLDLKTPSRTPEHRGVFLSADWLWQRGRLDVDTFGSHLADLIDNSRGQIDIEGVYRSHVELPVSLQAQFDERKGRLGAEKLQLLIGNSEVTGTVWIEEGKQDLYVRVHTPSFDVRQFLPPPPPEPSELPGLAVPDFDWWSSELQIDAHVTGDRLLLPRVTVSAIDVKLLRRPSGEQLRALFVTEGVGTFVTHGHTIRSGDHRNFDLRLDLSELEPRVLAADIPGTLSGALRLQGGGTGFSELLSDLTGTLNIALDFHTTEGVLGLKASPKLLIEDERILGIDVPAVSLLDSGETLTRGAARFDVRGPDVQARFEAERLDLDALLATLPASLAREGEIPLLPAQTSSADPLATAASDTETADEETPLIVVDNPGAPEPTLDLGALLAVLPLVQIELESETLKLFEREVSSFGLNVSSRPGVFELAELTFTSPQGTLDAKGEARAGADEVELEFDGQLGDLKLGNFLEQPLTNLDDPLDGSVVLTTRGVDGDDFLANLRGAVRLGEPEGAAGDRDLEVDLEFQPQGRGISAVLNTLRLRGSDLRGVLTFEPEPQRTFVVKLQSDLLDLRGLELPGGVDEPGESVVEDLAETTLGARTLGERTLELFEGVLSLPFDLLGGSADGTDGQFFSPEPYELEFLGEFELTAELELARVVTDAGVMEGMSGTASAVGQRFDVAVEAESLNGGAASLEFTLDNTQELPFARTQSQLEGFLPRNDPTMSPRTVFLDLEGYGRSEAELMGGINGELYLEGGAGRADFAELGLGFFTADLLSSVSRVLVPNRETTPQLECAVAYGAIEDGILTTPKGLVMQTRQANILMRAEVNMKEERLAAQFDSRSRSGAGVSMGNVFSNTVRVRGPLTDPGLVPNTTGILWRGWAALATGGLSLLGESFVKRMLSSDNACRNLREDIQELVCDGPTEAARSPIVCPVSQPASA